MWAIFKVFIMFCPVEYSALNKIEKSTGGDVDTGNPESSIGIRNPSDAHKMTCTCTCNVPLLKDELPRLVDAQCATGGKQTNSSKRCEKAEPKQKQPPVMDVSGGGSKV